MAWRGEARQTCIAIRGVTTRPRIEIKRRACDKGRGMNVKHQAWSHDGTLARTEGEADDPPNLHEQTRNTPTIATIGAQLRHNGR